MKLTIEFNLPEEREDFNVWYNGIDYYCALFEVYNYLRSLYKHDEREKIEIDEIYQKFLDIVYGIDLF